MDSQKETGELREEIQVVIDRLLKMKAYLEFDASSFFTCKSYYQQVQSLRKRFYEVLPVLRYRAKKFEKKCTPQLACLGANQQRLVISKNNVNGTTRITVPASSSQKTSSASADVSRLTVKPVISQIATSHLQSTNKNKVLIVTTDPEDLNSFLSKATEEVDSLTTGIEKLYFELEAEYKTSLMVNDAPSHDLKNLSGKIRASSIVLNITGTSNMNISSSDVRMLGAFDNEPIYKHPRQFLEENDEKPDVNQLDKISETTEESAEIINEEIERRKELFYDRFADRFLSFNDGQVFKVSSAFLIEKSSLFENILSTSNQINLGYNCANFKLFLDCLMEFQDCSVHDALQIYPIAYEFKVKKLMGKCEDVLKPRELNENLSLTLNMAVSVQCEELVKTVINFLLEKGRIFFFFSEEKYYFSLSPEAVRELLCHLEIDSSIIKKIFSWGENYLKKRNEMVDLKAFFSKHRIMEKLAVACFETMGVKF